MMFYLGVKKEFSEEEIEEVGGLAYADGTLADGEYEINFNYLHESERARRRGAGYSFVQELQGWAMLAGMVYTAWYIVDKGWI